MSKYKVGDNLIIMENEIEDAETLAKMSRIDILDSYAKLSYGIKILNVEYDGPDIILTYKNCHGKINKIRETGKDNASNRKEALKSALLKAFQSEMMHLSITQDAELIG